MSYLEQQLPTLAAAGFELVTPSQLLTLQDIEVVEAIEEVEQQQPAELPAELPSDKSQPQPILELYRSLLKLSSL